MRCLSVNKCVSDTMYVTFKKTPKIPKLEINFFQLNFIADKAKKCIRKHQNIEILKAGNSVHETLEKEFIFSNRHS